MNKTQKITTGYKQTDIGVIPIDWDIVTYGDAFKFMRTASYSRDQLGKGKTAYIHYGDIHTKWNHFVDLDQELPTISDEKVNNYTLIEDGDLIMADASEDYEGIGKSVEVKNKNARAAISGLHTFLLRDKANYFVKGFRGYIHANSLVKASMDRFATGLKVYGVSKSNLKLIQIPRPPLPEQTAISRALLDIEELITKLESLIRKKKNTRQGLMEKLLSGQHRLSGFSGKWTTKVMKDIGKPYGGLSGKVKGDFGGGNSRYIPFMNIMANPVIDIGFMDTVNILLGENQNKTQKGDLFFNGSSETPEEVGLCSVLLADVPNLYLNSFCFGFRFYDNAEMDGLFLAYLFRSSVGRSLLFSLAQGATRYNLSKTNFLKLEINVPKKEEQEAIAKLLRDLDSEIDALRELHSKYRLIKTGMMQQLLSGKIRIYAKK